MKHYRLPHPLASKPEDSDLPWAHDYSVSEQLRDNRRALDDYGLAVRGFLKALQNQLDQEQQKNTEGEAATNFRLVEFLRRSIFPSREKLTRYYKPAETILSEAREYLQLSYLCSNPMERNNALDVLRGAYFNIAQIGPDQLGAGVQYISSTEAATLADEDDKVLDRAYNHAQMQLGWQRCADDQKAAKAQVRIGK